MAAARRLIPRLGWGVGIGLGLSIALAFLLLPSLLLPANGASRIHGQGLVCSAFGGGPPYAFETYEATRDRIPYLEAQQLAATNQLFTANSDFALQAIDVGPFGEREPLEEATIPVPLLNAIGWIESRLNQGAIGVPYEGVGPVLISPSCAYGLMQVASFFSNNADTPSVDEALVGSHYAYNIAEGARILVAKWNTEFFPQLGSSNPFFVESWYYATWAYNGWAFVNHPAGTEVDPFRTRYDCDAPFNGYPYQELVLGCVENPPAPDDVPLWDPFPVALPNVGALAYAGGPMDPDVYFDGWASVFAAPFTGDDVLTPFAAMNIDLPQGAFVVAPPRYAPQVASAMRAAIFPSPELRVDESSIELLANEESVGSGTITIHNDGDGLLVYRLLPQDDWILVDIPAGVVVGGGFPLRADQPRAARVTITPDAQGLGEGLHLGVIIVEAIFPDGEVVSSSVTIVVDKQGVPRYEAGTPIS